jgi:hypothetical protein
MKAAWCERCRQFRVVIEDVSVPYYRVHYEPTRRPIGEVPTAKRSRCWMSGVAVPSGTREREVTDGRTGSTASPEKKL